MFRFKTDVQPGKHYELTIETDNKAVYEWFQEMSRAVTDGKQLSVTVTEKPPIDTIFVTGTVIG